MSRQNALIRLLPVGGRARQRRDACRSLELELAGYATPAERTDLELLAEAGRSPQGRELVAVLSRQAEVRLFRAS